MECHTTVVGTDIVVIGDEPPELGGEGRGPNPFALLQMGLAN
jgi:uncharacterized OsmC-like protein